MADAAHGFEEGGDGPVSDADGYTEGYAADGAAIADEDGEGDSQHHADGSDERVGQFFVPLDVEGGDVEAGVAKTFHVFAEFGPAHLEGLNDFAMEVGGRLDEFGECGDVEGRVASDGAFGKIADPAGFEDPGFLGVQPVGAGGEDAALHLKCDGVEFDDGEAAEELFGGIEEIVVVDLGIFPKNPALRAGVGLRRASLYLVVEGVLALVGVGEIGFVEDEKSCGDGDSGEEEWSGESIKADAAGFEGDDFVIFAEDAESDEDGDQRGERRELINEIRN